MTFSRYPEYKDSGIAWLEEVPAHWIVKRLRRVTAFNPSKSEAASLTRDTEVSFLPMEAVGDDGSLTLSRLRPIAELESGYTFFREGDVTIAKITPCFENGKGAVMRGLHNGYGFGTTELIVVRALPGETTGDYLHWLFTSNTFRQLGEAAMYGAGGQKRVPDDFVREFAIAFPPLNEQDHVVKFLAIETAKIDALVVEQEKLIALLKEKRQAVISHSVTKGLDPTVTMKDSRVEWLGQVPTHWQISRLKFVATIQTGVAKGKDNVGREVVEVPYLRVANVQDGYLALDDVATIELPREDVPRYLLRNGDVLMNEGGDFDKLGRGYIWRGEVENCIHQNHVFAVRPHAVSSEWLNGITGSDYAQFYFMTRSKQSTNLASISSTNIMELQILLPPEPEQRAILAFIEGQVATFDALDREARATVTLLRERRAALISAAVTGKIDVRAALPA